VPLRSTAPRFANKFPGLFATPTKQSHPAPKDRQTTPPVACLLSKFTIHLRSLGGANFIFTRQINRNTRLKLNIFNCYKHLAIKLKATQTGKDSFPKDC